tara:strand:+ start:2967 stop:3071 length:105 start_codon:yes stop_codon:yes gene_type:complete
LDETVDVYIERYGELVAPGGAELLAEVVMPGREM